MCVKVAGASKFKEGHHYGPFSQGARIILLTFSKRLRLCGLSAPSPLSNLPPALGGSPLPRSDGYTGFKKGAVLLP